MTAFDTTICELGEGPLWHPERQELFWFDITGQRLFAKGSGDLRQWQLPEMHSAAAWIDTARLLIASESGLWLFDIETGNRDGLIALEADNPITRSNDGRCDPWGGFWIGTMGKSAQPKAGAIYRYAQGELRALFDDITIPNAICFDRTRGCAYFTDTPEGILWRVAVDEAGWPSAPKEMLADVRTMGLNLDGAVVLADGRIAVACWGDSAVHVITPEGAFQGRFPLPAPHVTCPAMGGPNFDRLYCTSATEGLGPDDLLAAPLSGAIFEIEGAPQGLPEPAFPLI
ncbi:SMP-30/gluconolactonase/LRE family protein [Donghicola sp. XS_ASV15]|uniref:SMP-30/gluconolactonase/LRE family protein n=1 Tax=Donghicola sp. XS_ASV15 TaxID=3241295 RepID=UPI0035121E0D